MGGDATGATGGGDNAFLSGLRTSYADPANQGRMVGGVPLGPNHPGVAGGDILSAFRTPAWEKFQQQIATRTPQPTPAAPAPVAAPPAAAVPSVLNIGSATEPFINGLGQTFGGVPRGAYGYVKDGKWVFADTGDMSRGD